MRGLGERDGCGHHYEYAQKHRGNAGNNHMKDLQS